MEKLQGNNQYSDQGSSSGDKAAPCDSLKSEGLQKFGDELRKVLNPFSSKMNQTSPKKWSLLKTIGSCTREFKSKAVSERVITVITYCNIDRRENVMKSLKTILVSTHSANKAEADALISTIKGLFANYEGSIGSSSPNAIAEQQKEEETTSAAAAVFTDEKEKYRSELRDYLPRYEEPWFEDTTSLRPAFGGSTYSVGRFGTTRFFAPSGARGKNNKHTFKTGIMHGRSMKDEVKILINILENKTLKHEKNSEFSAVGNTNIEIKLDSHTLLNISLFERQNVPTIKCWLPNEKLPYVSCVSGIKNTVVVNCYNFEGFAALRRLCNQTSHQGLELTLKLTVDNFVKYEVVDIAGDRSAFEAFINMTKNA